MHGQEQFPLNMWFAAYAIRTELFFVWFRSFGVAAGVVRSVSIHLLSQIPLGCYTLTLNSAAITNRWLYQ